MVSISHICDVRYPICNEYYNELWDKMKHQMYLICMIPILIISSFKINDKFEPFVQMIISGMVLGVIPQMVLEKHQNRFEPQNIWDFVWLLVSFFPGLIKYYYVRKRSGNTK